MKDMDNIVFHKDITVFKGAIINTSEALNLLQNNNWTCSIEGIKNGRVESVKDLTKNGNVLAISCEIWEAPPTSREASPTLREKPLKLEISFCNLFNNKTAFVINGYTSFMTSITFSKA
jgi:hypothetical protein